jgi:uncharacterized protein
MKPHAISAEAIIRHLSLSPLPFEGGYFRRTYECGDEATLPSSLGYPDGASRRFCTAIYFLVTPDGFSALHRVRGDELFHFYAGDPVEMLQIDPAGRAHFLRLGPHILEGEQPQVLVPRKHWQGLRLLPGGSWALLGCTVAPGFEFEDFELAQRDRLIRAFPALATEIQEFTRS